MMQANLYLYLQFEEEKYSEGARVWIFQSEAPSPCKEKLHREYKWNIANWSSFDPFFHLFIASEVDLKFRLHQWDVLYAIVCWYVLWKVKIIIIKKNKQTQKQKQTKQRYMVNCIMRLLRFHFSSKNFANVNFWGLPADILRSWENLLNQTSFN